MHYDPHTWSPGDKVTSAKLNEIEAGLNLLNEFIINFEFTETTGIATVNKTLMDVQLAHQAGYRIFLEGMMDGGAVVRVEVNGFVYYDEALVAWTTVVAASGPDAPTGVYLIQGSDNIALFNYIPVA